MGSCSWGNGVLGWNERTNKQGVKLNWLMERTLTIQSHPRAPCLVDASVSGSKATAKVGKKCSILPERHREEMKALTDVVVEPQQRAREL